MPNTQSCNDLDSTILNANCTFTCSNKVRHEPLKYAKWLPFSRWPPKYNVSHLSLSWMAIKTHSTLLYQNKNNAILIYCKKSR